MVSLKNIHSPLLDNNALGMSSYRGGRWGNLGDSAKKPIDISVADLELALKNNASKSVR